jgi:hypothetical protein
MKATEANFLFFFHADKVHNARAILRDLRKKVLETRSGRALASPKSTRFGTTAALRTAFVKNCRVSCLRSYVKSPNCWRQKAELMRSW